MIIKSVTKTVHTLTVDGKAVETRHNFGHTDNVKAEAVGDTLVVAYTTFDHGFDDNLDNAQGRLYSFHNSAPLADHRAGLAALGRGPTGEYDSHLTPNIDAVKLDCFGHGVMVWSVSGEGQQCQFDTAKGVGVWVPNADQVKHLDSDEAQGLDRHNSAKASCRDFLETYNAVQAGEVYGIICETYKRSNAEAEWVYEQHNAVWGYIGLNCSIEARDEVLAGEVSQLKFLQGPLKPVEATPYLPVKPTIADEAAIQLVYLVAGAQAAVDEQRPLSQQDHPIQVADGHIGMTINLLPYAKVVAAYLDAVIASGHECPGVFQYEVTENLGRYLASVWHSRDLQKLFEAKLQELGDSFFNRE